MRPLDNACINARNLLSDDVGATSVYLIEQQCCATMIKSKRKKCAADKRNRNVVGCKWSLHTVSGRDKRIERNTLQPLRMRAPAVAPAPSSAIFPSNFGRAMNHFWPQTTNFRLKTFIIGLKNCAADSRSTHLRAFFFAHTWVTCAETNKCTVSACHAFLSASVRVCIPGVCVSLVHSRAAA